MDDSSFALANSVTLTGITSIAAGERAVFVEDTAGDGAATAATFKTFWGLGDSVQVGTYAGSGVSFGSGGDGVVLFDETGAELTRVSFGAASTGFSFDFSSGSPVLSVDGVNGAYSSVGVPVNVGSPGVTPAVPEPSAIGALGVAGLALVRRRR
jgi:hypothetical protein